MLLCYFFFCNNFFLFNRSRPTEDSSRYGVNAIHCCYNCRSDKKCICRCFNNYTTYSSNSGSSNLSSRACLVNISNRICYAISIQVAALTHGENVREHRVPIQPECIFMLVQLDRRIAIEHIGEIPMRVLGIEPPIRWVVVPCSQIVGLRFCVVVLAAIEERVIALPNRRGQIAEGIVGVACDNGVVFDELHYVAAGIVDIDFAVRVVCAVQTVVVRHAVSYALAVLVHNVHAIVDKVLCAAADRLHIA